MGLFALCPSLLQKPLETPEYLARWLGNQPYEELPLKVRVLAWLCGLEQMLPTVRRLRTLRVGPISRNIYEETQLSYIMHANMGLAIIVITIYWIYYSV